MRFAIALALWPCICTASMAQVSSGSIHVESAVANLMDNPAGSREIALKDKLASICNGKSKCSQAGDQLVPDPGFLIEIIYTCRDASGGLRQKGPLQIKASATVDLNCEE